jgi:hypothetical protein
MFICGGLYYCRVESGEEWLKSQNPYNANSIVVLRRMKPPGYTTPIRVVGAGFFTRKIFLDPIERSPTKAEVFWTRSEVAVMVCNSLGSEKIFGYSFAQGSLINLSELHIKGLASNIRRRWGYGPETSDEQLVMETFCDESNLSKRDEDSKEFGRMLGNNRILVPVQN